MNFFSIIFAFVFLVRSDATLLEGSVGSCSFLKYFCSARNCHTAFLKAFQKDPKTDCSVVFSKMKDCMVYLMKVCWRDQPAVASQAKTIINAAYKKEDHCGKTYFELPTMPPGNDLCSASFDNDISNCAQSFEQKFRKDKSDSALCSEYAKAKKCSRDVIDSDCNYPSETKELLDLLYDAYNPFCAYNRDPGATKNSPCSGVVIEKDPNAAAGTKPSVFQALMFAFFLFLFLFKA